jgi:hypothetical protein
MISFVKIRSIICKPEVKELFQSANADFFWPLSTLDFDCKSSFFGSRPVNIVTKWSLLA